MDTPTLPTLPLELCLKILYEYKGLTTPTASLIKKMNKTTPTARLIKKFIKMKDDKIWELKNEKENCVLWKYDAEHSWYLHLRDGKDYDLSWHDDYIWELENDLWSYPSINEYDYDGVNLFFKFVKKIHWETKLGWN